MSSAAVVITCEHASKRIPPRQTALFASADAVLASHRGSDIGALPVARLLARGLRAPLFAGTASRLLIDLNRSPRHPRLFSPWTRPLPPATRAALVAGYYAPFRTAVRAALAAAMAQHSHVVHVGVHSFTPVLDGRVRAVDIGVLYDPARASERLLAQRLGHELAARGNWRVRRNAPYRGVDDGHTTALRRQLGERYCGLELELNQRLLASPAARARVAAACIAALAAALAAPAGAGWPAE